MKKKLALFTATTMLMSCVGAMNFSVFAGSDNSISSVPNVAKDVPFTSANAPVLNLQESSTGNWLTGAKTFELKLENAEWASTIPDDGTITATVEVLGGATTATGTIAVTRKSDTMASAVMNVTAAGTNQDKLKIKIPMVAKATGGEAKVKIEALDSYVSAGTIVFANAIDGKTKAEMDSKTFADTVSLNTLKISELSIGAVTAGSHPLQLKLPAGFEWANSSVTASTAGGWTTVGTPTFVPDTTDGRIATLTLPGTLLSSGQRGIVYVSGLQVRRTSDAKIGDVTMNIKDGFNGTGFTEESIVVAKYAKYDVTVKALADPVTIYAGRYAASAPTDNDYKLVKLNLKEEVTNSWLANRLTKIQFNDEVKIRAFEFTKKDNISGGSIKTDAGNVAVTTGSKDCTTTNRNYIELQGATITSGQKADVEIQFWVSVKANYTGDIKATVSGSAFTTEQSVVLGKAVAPATMTATKADVKIGLKNQKVGDIVITEPGKDVWRANASGNVELVVDYDDGIVINDKGTVTVTKGDVTLGTVRTDSGNLIIPIKYSSGTASEITIKGLTVDVNRSVEEGKFEVSVGGDAIVENNISTEVECKFNKSSVVAVGAVNVITPAPGETTTMQKVVFKIDSKDFTVGDNKQQTDVAPFIDKNNRTMLPLRAFATALNIKSDNIVWDEKARTVTIFQGNNILTVVIGQDKFTKNGTVVPMDTQAIIKEGRTMLPIRAMGQALGATITWNETTREVTVEAASASTSK